MVKKSELLKELGWNEDLIQHFMIDDSIFSEHEESDLKTEMFETNSMTVTFNSENSGSIFKYET